MSKNNNEIARRRAAKKARKELDRKEQRKPKPTPASLSARAPIAAGSQAGFIVLPRLAQATADEAAPPASPSFGVRLSSWVCEKALAVYRNKDVIGVSMGTGMASKWILAAFNTSAAEITTRIVTSGFAEHPFAAAAIGGAIVGMATGAIAALATGGYKKHRGNAMEQNWAWAAVKRGAFWGLLGGAAGGFIAEWAGPSIKTFFGSLFGSSSAPAAPVEEIGQHVGTSLPVPEVSPAPEVVAPDLTPHLDKVVQPIDIGLPPQVVEPIRPIVEPQPAEAISAAEWADLDQQAKAGKVVEMRTAEISVEAPPLPPVPGALKDMIPQDMYAKLPGKLQKLAVKVARHGTPEQWMHLCKELSFNLLNKQDNSEAALRAGAKMLKKGIDVAFENKLLDTDLGKMLNRDWAFVRGNGIGVPRDLEVAMIHARHAGEYGTEMVSRFGKMLVSANKAAFAAPAP